MDVFLEAFERAAPGGFLVIDNGGRDDEGCIGDLTVAEAATAGIVGIVVWGYHRDTSAIAGLSVPVWSLGAISAGPRSARPRDAQPFATADVDRQRVTANDVVVADDDGVLFVSADLWPEVQAAAAEIVRVETAQAEQIAAGRNLREQLGFRDYLVQRESDPDLTFRQHLAKRGGAIET